MVIFFAVLGGVGIKVLRSAPPIPSQVVTTDGRVLFDGSTIQEGQGAWQSIGGQEVGTIWGHGSYIAPDWTADWLHRECTFILDRWAGRRLGVNVLFGALLFVVIGSLAGEWMSIQHKLGNLWFWFGTQGYEYVDQGRSWQILLFGGLTFWFWLMWRALRSALAKPDQCQSLLLTFLLSMLPIGLMQARASVE
jgi:nitric oxide reductase large subunit